MGERRTATIAPPAGARVLAAMIPKDAVGRNNALAAILMGGLPAVGGSAISLMLNAFFVWALVSLAFRRYPFRLSGDDRVLAWCFTAFAGLTLATALIAEDPAGGAWECISFLPFLSPWFVIPRLRASGQVDYLALYSVGAGVGAIAALLFTILEASWGLRPEGGAGNSAVFGVLALAQAGAAAVNLRSPVRSLRRLACAGLLCGVAACLASGTRGVWLASLPILLGAVLYAPHTFRHVLGRPAAIAAVLAGGLVLYRQSGLLLSRLEQTGEEWELVSGGIFESSMGMRLEIWAGGLQAFLDSPVWGHGIQHRAAIVSHALQGEHRFTHAHNGFLTAALDGGVLVLGAMLLTLVIPVAVAARAPRDEQFVRRLALASAVTLTYGLCGLTQIMFNHDIMDSFFIFTAIVVASSVATGRRMESVAGASGREGRLEQPPEGNFARNGSRTA